MRRLLAQRADRLIGLAVAGLLFSFDCTDSTRTPTGVTPYVNLSLSAVSISLDQGQSGVVMVSISRSGLFAGVVNLVAERLPANATATFEPASLDATATTSTLTIRVAATATTGITNILIRATGNGFTANPVEMRLVVSEPVPGFSLMLAPTAVRVAPGASGVARLTVLRTGGFTGAVTLTSVDTPPGVAVVLPSPLSGDTATVTITAASTVTPGSRAIIVTGAAQGHANQRATLGLQVVDPSAAGNVVYDFQRCGSSAVPIWFAYQDETGPWVEVRPDAGNVYRFRIGVRGGVAFVTHPPTGFALTVQYAALNEFPATTGARACGLTPSTGTKVVSVGIAGAGLADYFDVRLGGAGLSASQIPHSYTLAHVADGPLDLVAVRWKIDGAADIVVRHNTNYPDRSEIPPVDFDAESVQPSWGAIKLNGLGPDWASASTWLVTQSGSTGPIFGNGGRLPSLEYVAVPRSKQAAGDLMEIVATAIPDERQSTSRRQVITFLRDADLRTATLGPELSPSQVTSIGGAEPYPRLRAQFASQREYAGNATATFAQGVGGIDEHTVSVSTTSSYFGGTPSVWTLEIPILSGAGFNPAWALRTGPAVDWVTTARRGDFLALVNGSPNDGAQIYSASRASSPDALTLVPAAKGAMIGGLP